MKILCTGASGYVASALIPELLNKGNYVKVIDIEPLNNPFIKPYVEFTQGDIRDLELMGKLIDGMDTVIHLAAVVPTHPTLEEQMDSINFKGTCNLGALCRIKGVSKMLFSSSCSVYGSGANLTEKSKLSKGKTVHAPNTSYASGKMTSENFLLSLRTNEFSPIIMRFATVFGASSKISWQSLVNMFVKDAIEKKQLEIKYPDAYRPFCHVRDIVKGILLLLEQPTNIVSGQIYNIGGINATKVELVELIKEFMPYLKVIDLGGKDSGYSVNFNKIEKMGFKVTKQLKDGIYEIKEALDGSRVL